MLLGAGPQAGAEQLPLQSCQGLSVSGRPPRLQADRKGQRGPGTLTQCLAGQRGGRGPRTVQQVPDPDEAAARAGSPSHMGKGAQHPKAGGGQCQAAGLTPGRVSKQSLGWNPHRGKRKGLVVWGQERGFPTLYLKVLAQGGTQQTLRPRSGRSFCWFHTSRSPSRLTLSLPRPLVPLPDAALCGPHAWPALSLCPPQK